MAIVSESPGVLTLAWPSVPDALGYKVERRTETGEYTLLFDLVPLASNTQTFIDSAVAPDSAFCYRVVAYKSTGADTVYGPLEVATMPPWLVSNLAASENGGADAMLLRSQPGVAFGASEIATLASFYQHDDITIWEQHAQASKIYLRFNLDGMEKVTRARLKLTAANIRRFEETGYLNTQILLLADVPANWAESGITWNNAPQNNTTAAGFNGVAKPLGYLYQESKPIVGEECLAELDFVSLTNLIGVGGMVTLGLHQYDGATGDWATRENQTLVAPVLELSSVNPASRRPGFFEAKPDFAHRVRLQWVDLSDNESAFELERSVNNSPFTPLQMLPSNVSNFVDVTSQPNNYYEYRLRAVNPAAVSAWSRVFAIITPDQFFGWGTVWDGDRDQKFSNALNWDMDLTPPFDGTVYLNFAARGALAKIVGTTEVLGISLHGTNEFTIAAESGQLLIGAGGLRAAAPLPSVAMRYTIAADIGLVAPQTWGVTNSENGATTLLLSGEIEDHSTACNIIKSGNGRLILAGNNRFGGALVVADGTLCVHHDHALGTQSGNTDVKGGAVIELGNGVTIAEPLILRANAVLGASGTTTNTWTGPITLAAGALPHAFNNSTLILSGAKSAAGNLTLGADSNAVLMLAGAPLLADGRVITATGGGVVALGAPECLWSELRVAGATLRMEAEDVLPPNSTISFGQSGNLDGTLDLNGFSQRVTQFKRGSTAPGSRLVTSDTPATLSVDYSGGSALAFDGAFSGEAGLVKLGSGTLQMTSADHSSGCSYTVSNGVLRFSSASLAMSTNVTLRISAPGKLQMQDNVVVTVHELILDGGRKFAGTWGASGSGADNIDDVHFVGKGRVIVPYGSSSAWDGGASVASVDQPFNWDYDNLPELFNGSRTLAFGVDGHLATINTNIHLRGVILNRCGDFLITADGGSIKLGADALWAANPAANANPVYTIAAPVEITGAQTWCVTNIGAAATVTVLSGPLLDSGNNYPLSKSGDGVLSLAGDNSGYGGAITVLSGSVLRVAHRYGLGGGSAPVVVNYGGTLQVGGGVEVERAVVLNGGPGAGVCALLGVAGTNIWCGAITQAQESYIGASAGGTLVLAARPSTGNLLLAPAEGGCVLIDDKPLLMGTRQVQVLGAGTVAVGIGGNTWGTLAITCSGSVRTDAPNVLPPGSTISFGATGMLDGTLDLNGQDQTVAQIKRGVTTPGRRVIVSKEPATLTVNYSGASITFDGVFDGAVALVKSGSGTLIIAGTNSYTRGYLRVEGGTVRLEKSATFERSQRIFIDNGTLYLRGEYSLADTATVKMAALNAHLQIDTDLVETVSTLWIGGTQMRRGTYGSNESAAQYKNNTHFSGKGVLRVLHGPESLMILR